MVAGAPGCRLRSADGRGVERLVLQVPAEEQQAAELETDGVAGRARTTSSDGTPAAPSCPSYHCARLVEGWSHSQRSGYILAREYQMDALEQEILTAMTQKTIVTVSLDEGLGEGTVALSGATLPYVVLCPPAAKP